LKDTKGGKKRGRKLSRFIRCWCCSALSLKKYHAAPFPADSKAQ